MTTLIIYRDVKVIIQVIKIADNSWGLILRKLCLYNGHHENFTKEN